MLGFENFSLRDSVVVCYATKSEPEQNKRKRNRFWNQFCL